MITVTADAAMTGLFLMVEDNTFNSMTLSVEPPEGYAVCLPYSQQYASQVCSVIRSAGADCPDLLKIDFCLTSFDDENLPYTVSRFYSIEDKSLVEVKIYDTTGDYINGVKVVNEYETETESDADYESPVIAAEAEEDVQAEFRERMNYIPESCLYQTEPLKFMPEPEVAVNADGSLSARIVTYTLDPYNMTMYRAYENCSLENPLYYGYAAHAIAGSIYRYFTVTSLNVTDYSNYVEIQMQGEDYSQYFFKVDDPRFSTLAQLRAYVGRYFSEEITNEMFSSAPQKYRDINGKLYTILGDGGTDDSLGKLTITDWLIDKDFIVYYTQQEKLNENGEVTGFIDGGNFSVRTKGNDSFIVEKYRYPDC